MPKALFGDSCYPEQQKCTREQAPIRLAALWTMTGATKMNLAEAALGRTRDASNTVSSDTVLAEWREMASSDNTMLQAIKEVQ